MKKQLILVVVGLALTISLFFFGRTVAVKSKADTPAPVAVKSFNIKQYIEDFKKSLTPTQVAELNKMENSVTRGDVVTQQVQANNALANYWKDTIKAFEPYLYYISEAAKLENSEKNLTFAAQLNLHNLRGEQDEAKINWQAEEAIDLFQRAIKLNPTNDTLKVGLGSCYVFGKGRIAGPAETMKGIQQLLEVVRRDSTNMEAQLVLGIGGYTSGQFDKAIERLLKVIKAQPDNLQPIAFLADTYAAKGEKAEAIKWYTISKKMAKDPHYSKEVDQRIKEMN